MIGAVQTRLRRWRERARVTPPLLSLPLFLYALRGQSVAPDARPASLFVLSTGRCGTQTLSALFALLPCVNAFHEPPPNLDHLARRVYALPAADSELVCEALRLARGPLFQATALAGKRYVETGYYATFLAPQLRQILPDIRFLHLTRAAAPFVRSATGRDWYAGNPGDPGRIVPRPAETIAAVWEQRDSFARNAWLWAETNRFARDFLASLPPGQGLHLRSEDIFRADPQALRQLFALVDSEPPARHRIERVLGRQLNAGRYRSATKPLDLVNETQLATLQRDCAALAQTLGYESVTG